jgi:hypothetical protein
METSREKSESAREFHSAADDQKRRKALMATPLLINTNERDKTKNQPTLRKILPKSGFIWPFDRSLLGSAPNDATLIAAFAQTCPRLSTATLQRFFPQIFEQAIEALQDNKKKRTTDSNPIPF